MARTISDEDVEAIARKVIEMLAAGVAKPAPTAAASTAATLRNVYSVEQFRVEVLGGHRSPKWVRLQIRTKKIRVVASRPYLIPQSEAVRFLNAGPSAHR
jgi:hypothetical protein